MVFTYGSEMAKQTNTEEAIWTVRSSLMEKSRARAWSFDLMGRLVPAELWLQSLQA